jgi:hypothetical protein
MIKNIRIARAKRAPSSEESKQKMRESQRIRRNREAQHKVNNS